MILHKLQLPPPTVAQDFEYLCLELFRRVWGDEYAQLHGVSGQSQDGVDIMGRAKDGSERIAVQCKVRGSSPESNLHFKEILADVKKADRIDPPLHRLLFATTARRSSSLQSKVFAFSNERLSAGMFPVTVLAWEDICELLAKHLDIARRFFSVLFPPENASNELPVCARSSERSERLRTILVLFNEECSSNKLTISEIALQAGVEKISLMENYFSGTDDPPISLLKRISELFCLDLDWLLHGAGRPFYQAAPFFFEPGESLQLISSSKPDQIFFVRSDSDNGECTIVLKYNDWKYHCLNTLCNVSSHVGGTGKSQLLSFHNLVAAITAPHIHFHCTGQTLKSESFSKLIDGAIFPGSLLGKPHSGTDWWYDLLDLHHKHSTARHYKDWYGQEFLDAQRIIREQIEKEKVRPQ